MALGRRVGPAAGEDGGGQEVEGQGVRRVEGQAGGVEDERVEPAGEVLGREEQPGQRLVDAEPEGSEGPDDLGQSEAAEVAVVLEVLVVVPVDETVVECREEGQQCDRRQGQRDRQGQGRARATGARARSAAASMSRPSMRR